jgi:hypothetical protein
MFQIVYFFFITKRMSFNFFDFRPFDADEVVERLWVGSVDAATDLNELHKHGITHILIVAHDLEPKHVDKLTYMRVKIDVRYLNQISLKTCKGPLSPKFDIHTIYMW